jgi:hypothetical protein
MYEETMGRGGCFDLRVEGEKMISYLKKSRQRQAMLRIWIRNQIRRIRMPSRIRLRFRILPFSKKCVEGTEIMLDKIEF